MTSSPLIDVPKQDLISSLFRRWDEFQFDHSQALAMVWHEIDPSANKHSGQAEEICTWNYQDLKIEIEKSAGYLESFGLQKGEILGLQVPRNPMWLPLFLGALSRGFCVLLLNDSYTAHELSYYLLDAQAKLAFIPQKKLLTLEQILNEQSTSEIERPRLLAAESIEFDRKSAKPLVVRHDLHGDLTAVLAYTSGTTGKPKGARIRHRDIMGTLQALHQAWDWKVSDRLIHTLPLFHIHGLFVAALGALWAGAQVVLLSRFEAQAALQAVEIYQASILMGVPTHHHRYLKVAQSLPEDHKPELSSLRLVTSGSAPLSAEHFQSFNELFGLDIIERYGMTEVGIVLSAPLHGPKLAGSVGFPLPGVQAKICDSQDQELKVQKIGELHISSTSLFEGYHRRPEATQKSLYTDHNGMKWMRTGDIAYCDHDGRYWLKGRASDLIISGGLNVYPKEIENEIMNLASSWIDELAVVGIEDSEWGERVEAFITTKDELAPPSEKLHQLSVQLRVRLAAYKCPKKITWLESIPKNALGKLQRFKLRDRSDQREVPHKSIQG